jgi:hypothetical protein
VDIPAFAGLILLVAFLAIVAGIARCAGDILSHIDGPARAGGLSDEADL